MYVLPDCLRCLLLVAKGSTSSTNASVGNGDVTVVAEVVVDSTLVVTELVIVDISALVVLGVDDVWLSEDVDMTEVICGMDVGTTEVVCDIDVDESITGDVGVTEVNVEDSAGVVVSEDVEGRVADVDGAPSVAEVEGEAEDPVTGVDDGLTEEVTCDEVAMIEVVPDPEDEN